MANVSNFGAVGDGKTDDTQALQHALQAGDGVLELNRGTYRITKPLVLDLTKQGYGAVRGQAGTSRLVMAGPGPALLLVGDHKGTAMPKSVLPQTWDKERFPIITDLEILGDHPDAIGIQLRKTMQTTVSRVLIRRCKHAIHLVERNRNFLLSDSHLYDNAEFGVFFDRCNLHQAIIHGCHISYNKKAGIRSFDGDVHNVQITGNDIEYNNHPGVDASPNGEPRGAEIWFEAPEGIISEVTLAGNTIQATVEPGGANIRIHGGPNRQHQGACIIAITGNVIGSQTRAIELKHAMRVTLSGNTIYDSAEYSILASHCSALAVNGNTFSWRGSDQDKPRDGLRFEDCEHGSLQGLAAQRLCSGSAETGAGVNLVRCRDFTIMGCQILDPLHRGIELEDCQRVLVTGNHIIDRRQTPTMRHAIRALGKNKHLVIQNNLVGGAKDRPIELPDGAGMVQGNVEV